MTTAKLKSMEKLLQEEVEKFRALQKGVHRNILYYYYAPRSIKKHRNTYLVEPS